MHIYLNVFILFCKNIGSTRKTYRTGDYGYPTCNFMYKLSALNIE